MNTSIHDSDEICKRLEEKSLTDQISSWAKQYLVSMIASMFSAGYHGKTVDIEQYSDRHRTSISRFLREDRWDDQPLEATSKKNVLETIYGESRKTGQPVLVIVDDTISSKTIPSSKAVHPIEAAGFHFSHLKCRQDYGHQAVGVLLSCNGITLHYDMIMYDKSVSKIDIVKRIADELPIAPVLSYLLCDSWYVCGKVADAFIRKGFYTVGAMKINRIISPCGMKMSVREYAETLAESKRKELFHLVTVKGRRYYVYRYEGNLNGFENAIVLLSYPEKAFGKEKALRVFISTNVALSDEKILQLYVSRWEIEVYFRDCKNKLAVDRYQIRSAKGIKRFWLITSIAYNLACCESHTYSFSEGFHRISRLLQIERISFIFDYALHGGEKSALLGSI
jgi:hypothetical protein